MPVRRTRKEKKRKAAKKKPFAPWRVGERRLASVPFKVPFEIPRMLIKDAKRSGRSGLYKLATRGKTTRYVIALVECTGPNQFIVLKKAVAPYSEPNPGERQLKALAEEFGLGWPVPLCRMRPSQRVEGLE
jgi:hypothetical protein